MNGRARPKATADAALVGAAAFGTAALSAALAREPRGTLLVLAVVGAAALVALGVRHRRALARIEARRLLVWVALLVPFAALIGPVLAVPGLRQLFAFRLLLLLAATLIAIMLIAGEHVTSWRVPAYAAPFGLWFVWLAVTLLWAPDKPAALRYLIVLATMLALMLATAFAGSSERRLRFLLAVLGAACGLTMLVALIEAVTGLRLPTSVLAGGSTSGGRTVAVTSVYSNENDLATYLTIAWPFLLAALLFTQRLRWRTFLLLGVALALFVFLHTGSRSSLVVIGLETLVLAPVIMRLSSPRGVRLSLALSLVVVAGLAWLALNTSENPILRQFQVANLVQNVEQGYGSGETRLGLTQTGLALAADSHLLGVGAGNAEGMVKLAEGDPTALGNLHNWWMEVLVDGGLPALAIYVLIYVGLMVAMYRVSRRAGDPLMRYVATATLVALIGYSVGSLGPSTAVGFAPMWVLFGVALAVVARAEALRDEAVVSTKPTRASPTAGRERAPEGAGPHPDDGHETQQLAGPA